MNETLHRCAGGLWLQGHTARASLLCSVGKIVHCVHYLSADSRMLCTAWWRHVAMQFVHLQAISMKPTQLLCAVISVAINNWDLNFGIKPVYVAMSVFKWY
jgi:hypothetical protein